MAEITVRKRHTIRKSEAASLFQRLSAEIGESAALFTSGTVERVEIDSPFTVYLVDKKPHIFELGDIVFPTLRGAVERPFPERRIVVDAGAIPFMAKGADVMRPGIVSLTNDVRKDHPVQIVDERHGKPLAIGIALKDGAAIMEESRGKFVRTIHHVGDTLWGLSI
ncbi:MAG: RNA-binding protein [Methanomicrobiaceae archaeon]|nr:RNA-binding protein [Methanomicrobiaceae archaeon]